MSKDIVDVALDGVTDYLGFERIALEVLEQQGVTDLVPLGGRADGGRDGVREQRFSRTHERAVTVVQVTTQLDSVAKVSDTITRLDEERIPFNNLTFVTSREVSGKDYDQIMAMCNRRGIGCTIVDRKVLHSTLSRYDNGTFHRVFPNFEQQFKELIAARREETPPREALLRTAVAFFASHEGAAARTAVVRNLTLLLLLHSGKEEASGADLATLQRELLPNAVAIPGDQLDAALGWLAEHGMAERVTSGAFRPTVAAQERMVASEAAAERLATRLGEAVVRSVRESARVPVSDQDAIRIARNAANGVRQFLRFYGLEAVNQIVGRAGTPTSGFVAGDAVDKALAADLGAPLAAATRAAVAELLSNPSNEEAESLRSLALGYLGACLIQTDPAVRELQATKLRTKSFILDTDFLLDCVCASRPEQRASLGLVHALASAGATLIVADECIEEVISHSDSSLGAFSALRERLISLPEAYVRENVGNVFVQGYYYSIKSGFRGTFARYMRNYKDSDNPRRFARSLILDTLGNDLKLGPVAELLECRPDRTKVASAEAVFYEMSKNAKGAAFRSDENSYKLATVDAQLYCCISDYCSRSAKSESNEALYANAYVVGSSRRFAKAAVSLGDADHFSVSPTALQGVLMLLGLTDPVEPKDFVSLFENRFLQEAVSESWTDVQALVDLGIDLSGVSVTRLTLDFEDGLHRSLTAYSSIVERADEPSAPQELADLVAEVMEFGYHTSLTSAEVFTRLSKAEAEAAEAKAKVAALEAQLRQTASGAAAHPPRKLLGRRLKRK